MRSKQEHANTACYPYFQDKHCPDVQILTAAEGCFNNCTQENQGCGLQWLISWSG